MIARVVFSGGEAILEDDGFWKCANQDIAKRLNAGENTNAKDHTGAQWGRFGEFSASEAAKLLGGRYEMIGEPPEKEPNAIY